MALINARVKYAGPLNLIDEQSSMEQNNSVEHSMERKAKLLREKGFERTISSIKKEEVDLMKSNSFLMSKIEE